MLFLISYYHKAMMIPLEWTAKKKKKLEERCRSLP
jgi:hypothetical protein